jgi:hypothetical protein
MIGPLAPTHPVQRSRLALTPAGFVVFTRRGVVKVSESRRFALDLLHDPGHGGQRVDHLASFGPLRLRDLLTGIDSTSGAAYSHGWDLAHIIAA